MKTSIIWKMCQSDLQAIMDSSDSFGDVLKKLGFTSTGGCWKVLLSRIKLDNLSTDILMENKRKKKRKFPKKIELSDILKENVSYSRGHLKRRLVEDGLLKNQCIKCGQGLNWNGEPLVMVLDHINGINNDNRLENLRMLCPNCNSQTKTFSGRNQKKNRVCLKCNDKTFSKSKYCEKCRPIVKAEFHAKRVGKCIDCGMPICVNSTRCRSCRSINSNRRKIINRPSKEVLLELTNKFSIVEVGRKYGVSDNTIRNWVKIYDKMANVA